jgi:hypothetical protein
MLGGVSGGRNRFLYVRSDRYIAGNFILWQLCVSEEDRGAYACAGYTCANASAYSGADATTNDGHPSIQPSTDCGTQPRTDTGTHRLRLHLALC